MKKLIYSLALVLVGLVSCTTFDDPTTENYGAGPSIDVTITPGAQTDSAFTITITPAAGAVYYAYVIDESDVAEQLDSATLFKGGYGNVVVKVADQPTTKIDIEDASPNTTYQVYAVAGSDKGIVGKITVKSITTTDKFKPGPQTIGRDADNASVQLKYSEAIQRGEGAVTAMYYKEWDIMNPVEIPAEDITVEVSGNAATFAAANIPAGAYLCFSYAAGAFVDKIGNPCGALSSGLNMNTGKFTGAYVHVTNQPFDITDAYVTAPENGALVGNAADFKGEITFPFNIYRNDEYVEAGDLTVTFTSDEREVTYKLNPSDWSVNEKVLTFTLPAAAKPEAGDIITVSVLEGAIADVYGNSNNAFSSTTWWKFFAPTVDMILSTFEIQYVSYWSEDGSAESMGTLTIEQDAEKENGLIIKGDFGLFEEAVAIEGSYDLSAGKLYIPDSQLLGIYTNSKGTKYGVIFATADGADAAAFTINADGTLTADGLWGLYAFDETFETEVGWLEVAKVSQMVPVKASARKAVAKKASKKTTIKLQKTARNLKKHVSK